MKEITINPVTRIEGHARVKINLDDSGSVNNAHFEVVELRGFEKFMIGAAVEEAPRLTPRICGICPTSHHIASAKACDQIYGAAPPATGQRLRELLMTGQYIHSHSLHFFMLAAPDFLVGHDAPAAERSVLGLVKKAPDVAKKAIEVRKFGQRLTEAIGGKPIHPSNCVPGGVSHAMTETQRQELLEMGKKSLEIAKECWSVAKTMMNQTDLSFGAVDTAFMGISKDGKFSHCDGDVNVVGKDGNPLTTFSGTGYLDNIEEYSEEWSYLKFSRLKNGEYYRVGPLARLNIIREMGTPEADSALAEYRSTFGEFTQTTLAFNMARYIEMLSCCEQAVDYLSDSSICGTDIRTPVKDIVNSRGVGIVEAPRGTLIHDYTVDEKGFMTDCNLIVATCQNNYGMDRGVEDVAKRVVSGGSLSESAANQIEMVIRAYDPCISCATHAIGQMPIDIELIRENGRKTE